jgi:hypothetical protein
MVDVYEISAIVAAAGVLLGVAFTVLQLRDLVKTRQTDLIMRLYSRYGSEGFMRTWEKLRQRDLRDFHDYVEKYGIAEWAGIGTFFEGIGILLHRKLVDISMVDDLFTAPLNMAWYHMKDSIVEARKEWNQPTILEWFEYLYNEMKKREQNLKKSKT